MPTTTIQPKAPLTDAILAALAKLLDDSQTPAKRQPSHSEIEDQFRRAGLLNVDPGQDSRPIGKAKRVRRVLQWSIENDLEKGERVVYLLITLVRGVGGFRDTSANYVGTEAIQDLRDALATEGFRLTETGEILPIVLDSLSGQQLTDALKAYVRRARRGVVDAALVTGTGLQFIIQDVRRHNCDGTEPPLGRWIVHSVDETSEVVDLQLTQILRERALTEPDQCVRKTARAVFFTTFDRSLDRLRLALPGLRFHFRTQHDVVGSGDRPTGQHELEDIREGSGLFPILLEGAT